jgi:hypothetical protein
VDREPETEQDQGEQQDRDDEQHGKLLSIGAFLLPFLRKTNAVRQRAGWGGEVAQMKAPRRGLR